MARHTTEDMYATPSRITMTKLNGLNYRDWNYEMEMVLREQGLWDIIMNKETAPTKEAGPEAVERYRLRSSRAYSIVALSLETSLRSLIATCSTPSEIWNTLRQGFEPTDRAHIAQLRREFYTITLGPDEPMVSFVSRLTEARKRLENAGKVVPEDEVAFQMVSSLPDSYETVVQAVYQLPDSEFIPAKVTRMLIAEYGRQQARSATLFATPSTSSFATRTGTATPTRANTRSFPNRKTQCFNCNKFGHIAKNCRAPKRTDDRRGRKSGMNSFCITVETIQATDVTTSRWILDGASTHHIVTSPNLCENFRKSNDRMVYSGGRKVAALGVANCFFKFCTGSHTRKFRMTDVIVVPAIGRNLISVRLMAEAGFTVVYRGKSVTIYDPNGTEWGTFFLKDDNLYSMHLQQITQDEFNKWNDTPYTDPRRRIDNVPRIRPSTNMAETRKGDIYTWHCRLGHISAERLSLLSKSKFLIGIPDLKEMLVDCEVCLEAKSKMTACHRVTNKQTSEPLELVHTDVWGPASIKGIGEYRYFVTFIDDFTRKAWAACLTTKDQVFEQFTKFLARVESQTGKKIKAIRTDNGLEYCNQRMAQFCQKNGIRHQRTNCYTPQMNGIAERLNYTLLDTIRALFLESGLPKYLWPEMLLTATYLKNRIPHDKMDGICPEEAWSNRKPSCRHLRRIGSLSFVHIPKQARTSKLNARAERAVLLGYAIHTRGYRLYLLHKKKVIESKHVSFIEGTVPCKESSSHDIDFHRMTAPDVYDIPPSTTTKQLNCL